MISMIVRSKFDINKEFVRFTLRRDRDSFVIDSIDSPLSSVSRGYGEQISAGFNYSFADERGFHEVFGIPNDSLRNSLILLAREEILNRRRVEFNFHNYQDINSIITNDQLINGLQHNPDSTISQIEHIFQDDDEKLYQFSIWISYFIYKLNLEGVQLDISRIADSILRSRKINMFIWSIDHLFMFDYARKGSYSEVRKLINTGTGGFDYRHLKFFSVENAMNYSHWRTSGSISIAARKIRAIDSLLTDDVEILLHLFQSQSQKTPLFMPKAGTPRATAINLLKHYGDDEPLNLNRLCDDIGINLHMIELDSELLGLFMNNPEAHQAAIFINRSRRTSRSHNYTIAHEIGHYLLHFGDFVIDCSVDDIYFPDQTDSKEVEANEFASELLMPASKIRECFSEGFNSNNVINMSSRFNVSVEAAARRRISLDNKRRLVFIVVRGQEVKSIFASMVKDDGTRWIGKRTIGKGAIQVEIAEQLVTHGERNLAEYLTDADSGNEILDDLDIDIYSFLSGDGYYLLVESHRR